ncbi:MAG: phosphatase PAP2 family protein [Nocardioides sp.]
MPESRTGRDRRSWPATAGLLLVGWVLLAAVVVAWGWLLTHHLGGSVGAADDALARQLADGRTASLSVAAEAAAYPGETKVGAVVLAVAGVVVAIARRTWLPLLFVLLVEVGVGGIYRLGTHLDPRDRPPVQILDLGLVPDHSFPSGHTGTAMAVFLGLAFLVWTYTQVSHGWALVLALVPIAVAASRLYQGAHHLSDVLTSGVYVLVWVAFVARLVLSRESGVGASA